jgi:hypothetical protein
MPLILERRSLAFDPATPRALGAVLKPGRVDLALFAGAERGLGAHWRGVLSHQQVAQRVKPPRRLAAPGPRAQ